MIAKYGIFPSINFTVEMESNGKLPFLDAILIRKEDGTIKVGVHRKQKHTDRYLLFNSHHPLNVKRGVVQCLVKRVERITTEEHLQRREMEHLSNTKGMDTLLPG